MDEQPVSGDCSCREQLSTSIADVSFETITLRIARIEEQLTRLHERVKKLEDGNIPAINALLYLKKDARDYGINCEKMP